MIKPTEIPTDLVTPLGAYLRLRRPGFGSFLLESVERGRLGRSSFVGSGSTIVPLAEAQAAAEPVVGYLAYDHVAELEPTVPLPKEGLDLPESRFVVAEQLVRFDHARGIAEVLAGDSDELAARLDGPLPELRRARLQTTETRRQPSAERYRRDVERVQEYIGERAPRRSSSTAPFGA
jgi:hypothetical protein